MPELPEVEIVKQSLEKKVKYKIIDSVLVKNPNLRFKIQKNFKKFLKKKKILSVDRRSKYIIISLEDNKFLLIHFGMSGTLHHRFKKNSNNLHSNLSFYNSMKLPKKHNHIEIFFSNFKIIYNDPRRFGFFKILYSKKELNEYFKKIGPEPFDRIFSFKYLKKNIYNKNINGKDGSYQKEFKVYDKEGKICPTKNCNEKIVKLNISNRSTYVCKICQK